MTNAEVRLSDICFTEEDDGSISLVGELNEQNAAAFAAKSKNLAVGRDTPVILNLHSFDIDDGVALAACVNVLRELRGRVDKLALRGAPQMLGHNLYRVGMLDGALAIELIEMRLDEPAGF